MKYRRLSLDELKELEKEFINFLSMNSIPAKDWERMKTDQPEEAESHIEMFSDLVLDKAIKNIQYLELLSERNALFFNCGKDKLVIYSITASPTSNIDFSAPNIIKNIANNTLAIKPGDLNLKKFEQDYTSDREDEIFKLTEQGALITDNTIIDTLDNLLE